MMEEKDRPPRKCFYCNEPMGSEFHIVVSPSGAIFDAHKRCHKRSQGGEINVRMIIK